MVRDDVNRQTVKAERMLDHEVNSLSGRGELGESDGQGQAGDAGMELLVQTCVLGEDCPNSRVGGDELADSVGLHQNGRRGEQLL